MSLEKGEKDYWAYDELADESFLVILLELVTYDNDKGIRGLIHSPFVLGAALLALFGYGIHDSTHSMYSPANPLHF